MKAQSRIPEQRAAMAKSLVLEVVEEVFGYTAHQVMSRDRSAGVAHARHVAMALLRDQWHMTFPQIGELLEREHGAVIHGVRNVRNWVEIRDRHMCRRLGECLQALAHKRRYWSHHRDALEVVA